MEKETGLLDEHLKALEAMKETGTDDFFYTRLKARMAPGQQEWKGWSFPLKPAWAIGTLALLLAFNGFMLVKDSRSKQSATTESVSSLQNFASSYDQTISSY